MIVIYIELGKAWDKERGAWLLSELPVVIVISFIHILQYYLAPELTVPAAHNRRDD